MLFWVPLLCAATGHAKTKALLRGRGYPIDSPNATWLPVEDEVDMSLADTRDAIETAKADLATTKSFCNGDNHGHCKRQVERMSARLDRLIAAEKQLRDKDEAAKKVEDGVKEDAETVIDLENQVSGLHAVKKFAQLSKEDFDRQEKRLDTASEEYAKKIDDAQIKIDQLKLDLKRARRLHYGAEQKSLNEIAKAKSIEKGVETTDLYADTALARAIKKERVAEGLYARADAIRDHAEKMMVLHHDEKKSEVKEVMYGTAHRLITDEDVGIVNFGHMSDFGGNLPHDDPCKKTKKVKKPIKEEDDEAIPPKDDEWENISEKPSAPAAETDAPATTTTTSTTTVAPTTTVATTTTQYNQNTDVGSNDGEGMKVVEMKDANDNADNWVALHHHGRSKVTVSGGKATKMLNPHKHSNDKPATQPVPAVPTMSEPKTVEPKKEPEVEVLNADDDLPQPLADDESSGAEEKIAATTTDSAIHEESSAADANANIPSEADSQLGQDAQVAQLASEDENADVDDSAEAAQADVDMDSANMDLAEQQFAEAKEAEDALMS